MLVVDEAPVATTVDEHTVEELPVEIHSDDIATVEDVASASVVDIADVSQPVPVVIEEHSPGF